MTTIAFIGAGSTVFTRRLAWELTSYPELADCELRLMDVDADRLDLIRRYLECRIEHEGLPARVTATLDRREAIRGADFVCVSIHPGGDDAAVLDLDIPERYGITQPIGDTLGPGGIFRGLRTAPHVMQIGKDVEELAPQALLLQHSNPMAICCWSAYETSDALMVGLCHGAEWTRIVLAGALGVAPIENLDAIPAEWGGMERVTYRTAGINHMAWYLDIRLDGRDVQQEIYEKLEREGLGEFFKYEWFRVETWRRFGRFLTESPLHHSEYVPFYRKHPDVLEEHCPEMAARRAADAPEDRGHPGSEQHRRRTSRREQVAGNARRYREQVENAIANVGKDPSPDGVLPGTWTPESAARIIRAIVARGTFRFQGNVRNEGHITNLPEGACVEVPCFADEFGISATHVGPLPTACAALCRTNINAQELTVRAVLEGRRELAKQALLLDPLTSSILTPEQTWRMADEMFEAEAQWLPHMR